MSLTPEFQKIDFNPLGGSVSVMVTAYKEDHSVDYDAMVNLCAHMYEGNADGVFVVGSTGDMPYLRAEERASIVAAARKGFGPHRKVLGGITDWSIEGSIEMAKRLADAGADIGVIMPPLHFLGISQSELIAWFNRIADQSPIPVLLYHHMALKTPIRLSTILAIADHPNIIGMKETDLTIDRTEDILAMTADKDFILMQGRECFASQSHKLGSAGSLAALGGVWPELFYTLDRSYRNQDYALFDEYSQKLDAFNEVFSVTNKVNSISNFTHLMRLMLNYRGWLDNNHSRFGNLPADPEADAQIVAVLDKIEFPKK